MFQNRILNMYSVITLLWLVSALFIRQRRYDDWRTSMDTALLYFLHYILKSSPKGFANDLWGSNDYHRKIHISIIYVTDLSVVRCLIFIAYILTIQICNGSNHYSDVLMDAMSSQITSLTIVCSTVHSAADQRKHQSSALLVSVTGESVTWKMFPFDDVSMILSQPKWARLNEFQGYPSPLPVT